MALAYPDRVAQRRSNDSDGTQVGGRPARFLLAHGRGALLPPGEPLGKELWLAVAQLDGGRTANDAEPEIRVRIEELLGHSAVPVDEIVRLSGAETGAVQLVLLELDLAGRLDRHAGNKVSLNGA